MNDEDIKEKMISFIKKKERDAVNARVVGDNKLKSDIVNSILKEIEKEIPYED